MIRRVIILLAIVALAAIWIAYIFRLKIFLAFFTIPEEIRKQVKECVDESKIDLTKLPNADNWDKTFFENHENLCFIKCMAIKRGTANEDGTLNIENIKSMTRMDETFLKETEESCNKIISDTDDECAKTAKLQACTGWEMFKPQLNNVLTIDTPITKSIRGCEKESSFSIKKMIETPTEVFSGKEIKCFLKCMAVKYEIYTENGEPVVDKIVEISVLSDNTELKEVIEKCKKGVEETDVCEKYVKLQACIVNPMILEKFMK